MSAISVSSFPSYRPYTYSTLSKRLTHDARHDRSISIREGMHKIWQTETTERYERGRSRVDENCILFPFSRDAVRAFPVSICIWHVSRFANVWMYKFRIIAKDARTGRSRSARTRTVFRLHSISFLFGLSEERAPSLYFIDADVESRRVLKKCSHPFRNPRAGLERDKTG